MRVAIYTRVSTDIQAGREEGSLETQEARLRAYLTSRGDHVVAGVYREEGASGKSLDRPELQRLLRDVQGGQLDLIVVTRLDRLSRSLLDFFEVHALLEKHEVAFTSLNESFDTSTPLGRAMLKLVLVFAELEREQTADRTRQAMRARSERGLWNGGAPPLGYDSQGNGHLDVNDEEARVVRLAFDRYCELRSAPKLAKWLNGEGYRQKRYVSRRKGPTGGKKFSAASVRIMLRNQLYLGKITHKGDVFEGQHDPIVDTDVFDRVQAILDGNAVKKRGPQEGANYPFPLVGVLRCSCGYAMSSLSVRKPKRRYFYYECISKTKDPERPCEVKRVRAKALDEAALKVLRDAARSPEIVDAAVEEANRMITEQFGPLQAKVDDQRRELAQVEDEGKRLIRKLMLSDLDDNNFGREMVNELEERRTQLRDAIARGEAELASAEMKRLDAEYLREALLNFDAVWDSLDDAEKRELLQTLVLQVVVHTERIDVDLYDGRNVCEEWLKPARRKPLSNKTQGTSVKPEVCPGSEVAPAAGLEPATL
ncbi:MAG: recombinase family protein [Deltaproteobacteria bacterium]|nr:MAG: recombinase family protein [Deltaproteobacteria bacterium]